MKRLVVVGGGISGLAAAHAAIERLRTVGGAPGLDVVVLEKETRVGGKALTAVDGDWVVECGPTGFLAPDPTIDRLVRAAGVAAELVPADAAAVRRFVVRGGRMRQVSAHPVRFATAGILGPWGLVRLLAEPLVPGRPAANGDESVWDFARRRLGRQAADRLVAPMVLGVFAGDAKRLSLAAAFPRLAALEAEHGSLVRGMIARRREARSGVGAAAREAAAPSGGPVGPGGPAGPAGHLTSFGAGLERLPAALAASVARAGARVRCGSGATAIARGPGGELVVRLDGETLAADAVVVACEAWAAADLLAGLAPPLARLLGAIAYPPVVVIALGFEGEAAARIPRGFGVLIPRGEGYRALGVLWDSHIFPGRSPRGTTLVRVMVGGAVDSQAGTSPDDELVAAARADLRRLLGVDAPPIFTRVVRWPRAIPQYELGHGERVAAIARELVREPGIFLAGNALHGIAFGKAAAAGLAAGDAAAQFLARS